MSSGDPDKLSSLLREWQDVPRPSADLAARVRSRVARSGRADATGALSWRLAVAALALGSLLGAAAIEVREARAAARRAADMPASYLAWIAPQSGSDGQKP